MLNTVQDPILLVDEGNQVLLNNIPAGQLFVANPGDSPGKRGAIRTNNALLSASLSRFRLDRGTSLGRELALVDPIEGNELLFEVICQPATNVRRGIRGLVVVLNDVTDRRRVDEDLRRVQQQLFDFEKLAAVGRLAAAVAHEINNPPEAIKNALYLAVTSLPEGDRNREYLEIASKEMVRVSGIMRQMLGFYRPTAEKVPTDVNRVVADALSLLQRQLRQHQVVIRHEPDPSVPSVLASPHQLKQVLLNLFLNAQEAMPRGGTLYVTTRLSQESDREFLAGPSVLVQVRDTGVGISEDDLQRIFEPFYSTKSETRGTGLGLWVSLGIIQSHEGQIKVRSRLGRGTTFTIALPPLETA
jgi:signal transduction histidine kinase